MKKNIQNIDELKEILTSMEEIVVVIDKIGSGFVDENRTASALLLFFNQCNVLDKLSKTRKYLYHELESKISSEEFDEWIENGSPLWRPPYDKSEEEILEMLKNNKY
ncbi:hypothetical protein [Serratia sp. Tan611]|uniref:hypothetical protein n=1 Tax=Serratia sp. Tan611 TaxID=2773264 RepID=UPI00193450CF|nr:hypothetical protein [Serratia sp. Tan611]CAE1150451.1 conserved protein of unknown function [Serratia sp. Tan611]